MIRRRVSKTSSAVPARPPQLATSSLRYSKKNTQASFTKVEEVIYQASAKNSRQRELLIQDTLPPDINNKDIIALEAFFRMSPDVFYHLSRETLLLASWSFCARSVNRDLDRNF